MATPSSRQHARISRTPDGGVEITDLNSTNGTHVNGVRISGSARLSAGDTVRVGQTTINVHAGVADAGRTVVGSQGPGVGPVPEPAGAQALGSLDPPQGPPAVEEPDSDWATAAQAPPSQQPGAQDWPPAGEAPAAPPADPQSWEPAA